jgi:hypothetical protein
VPPQDLAPAVASPQLAETAPGDAHAEPVTASTLAAPDTVDAEPAARSSIRVTPPRPVASVPVLVIDDAAPELAEAEQAERAAKQERRSFLPASLLDDRGSRQGGLTLAVIILLIVATLTLSYLMRRPSASGEGVTQAPAATPLPPG